MKIIPLGLVLALVVACGQDSPAGCEDFTSGSGGKALSEGIDLAGTDEARSGQLLREAEVAAREHSEQVFTRLADAVAEYRTALEQQLPPNNAAADVHQAIGEVRDFCA